MLSQHTPSPVDLRCPRCAAAMREFAHATGHFTVVCCAACATTFRLAVDEGGARAVGHDRSRKVLRFPGSRRAS